MRQVSFPLVALLLAIGCVSGRAVRVDGPPGPPHTSPSPAAIPTSGWRNVQSMDPSVPAIDFDSTAWTTLRDHGKLVRVVWVRVEYQKTQLNSGLGIYYKQAINQYAITCDGGDFDLVRSNEYDEAGRVVSKGGTDASLRSLKDPYNQLSESPAPLPKRAARTLVRSFCSYATRPPMV